MKKLMRKALCSLLVVLMCFTSVAIGGFSASAKVYNGTTYITKSDLESGYIELGSYPQTLVASDLTVEEDRVLYTELLKLAVNADKTSYGYYSGTGEFDFGTMQKDDDMMTYVDVTYKDEKYRGVYIKDYRPYDTIDLSSADNSYQDNNNYRTGYYYFFKYEPLKWRVLDKETGLIMCESIIDSQAFNNTIYEKRGSVYGYTEPSGYPLYRYLYYIDAAYTNKANNFSKSSLRSWLNNDFYNTAFSVSDKTAIANTEYSLKNIGKFYDKVTLPSNDDVYNTNYGFIEDDSSTRQAQGTDYAKCQGLQVYEDYSWWHLLDAVDNGFYDGKYSCEVTVSGRGASDNTYDTSIGVRPVMTIDMTSLHTHNYTYKEITTRYPTHLNFGEKRCICVCGASKLSLISKTKEHTFNTVVDSTPATCTQTGSITKSCACGATNTEVVPTTPHNFNGSVCTTCGYNRANDCSCNCHKSGIAHFFFVIVNFFEKLFGNNKICACGAAH